MADSNVTQDDLLNAMRDKGYKPQLDVSRMVWRFQIYRKGVPISAGFGSSPSDAINASLHGFVVWLLSEANA